MDITPPPLPRTEILIDKNELLTIHQVATLLNISQRTLQRWDKNQRLPAIRLHARGQRLYRKSTIEEIIKNGLYLPNNAVIGASRNDENLNDINVNNEGNHEVGLIIELKKLGSSHKTTEEGRDAWKQIQSMIENLDKHASIDIDFREIEPIDKPWAKEFLLPLYQKYGNRMAFRNIANIGDLTWLELLGLYKRPPSPLD